MATRLYLRASTESTPISPTPSTDWEDTGSVGRALARKNQSNDALATVSFTDANNANRDCLLRQYVSMSPLFVGQTVTGAQALKAQVRCAERIAGNNMFLAIGIRVIASDGSTVRKVMLAVTRDGLEVATSLTNRQFTATSAATNYTAVAGDRLVIEVGAGGDPANSGGADHDYDLRLGDPTAGSDLAENDTATTDDRPWIEFADTWTFGDVGAVAMSGAGDLAAAALVTVLASTAQSGAGDLVASALLEIPAAGALSGTGSLTAVGEVISPIVDGAAALSGAGDLAASAQVDVLVAAALQGDGVLAAAGMLDVLAAGTLAGSGQLAADAMLDVLAAASVAGAGDALAAGIVIVLASATLQGQGTLTAVAAADTVEGAAVISGLGSMTASGMVIVVGAADPAGAGVLTAAAQVQVMAAAAMLSGNAGGIASATILVMVTVSAAGAGALVASGVVIVVGAGEAAAGDGALVAVGDIIGGEGTVLAAATLAAYTHLRARGGLVLLWHPGMGAGFNVISWRTWQPWPPEQRKYLP